MRNPVGPQYTQRISGSLFANSKMGYLVGNLLQLILIIYEQFSATAEAIGIATLHCELWIWLGCQM